MATSTRNMDSVGPTLLGNMFLIEEEVPRRTSSSAAPDAAGVGSFVSCEWSPGHLPHKSAEISVTYQAVWVDAEEKPEKSGGVGLPCIKWARLEENQATFFWGETSEVLPHQHMVFPQVWQVCLQISTGHPPHPAARPSPMLVCYPWGNPLWMCRCERTNERNRTEPTLVQTQVGHSRTRHRSGCLFIAPKSRDLGCP